MFIIMGMQVMLRMEETRRIRMKQRADKRKEEVMRNLIKNISLRRWIFLRMATGDHCIARLPDVES